MGNTGHGLLVLLTTARLLRQRTERETVERKPNWPSIWKKKKNHAEPTGTTGNMSKTSRFAITAKKNKVKKDKTNQRAASEAVYVWSEGKWRGKWSRNHYRCNMLLCNECNFIFVTVYVSKLWSPSVMPKKAPAVSNVKKIATESLCIFHYSEDEKAAAESELPGNFGTPRRNTLINTGG